MAIQDRKLSTGTQLFARYKGQTYTCQVVETEQGPRYRLADGRESKSPSAAGSAVMDGHACNGWAFWAVGDGATATGPVRSAKAARPEMSTVRAAPKPTKKGRACRKPKADAEVSPRTETPNGVECLNCGAVFATQEEALAHMETAHGAPTEDPRA